VTCATAERALSEFLGRVEQVNRDPYFLGKVVRVVLFGSMLKPEVVRLSDVDLAVELVTKEADFDRAREENYRRAEELVDKGHRFRNVVELEFCWQLETFRYLKRGKPRNRSSRLQGGEVLRPEGSASRAARRR
jgi:predicted nucleotidyltransferase